MKVAFGFNGQGIQNDRIYKEILSKYPETNKWIDLADSYLNYDLRKVLEDTDLINKVEYTQVIVFVINHIIYQYFMTKEKIKPKMIFGHSLGHYNALVCANVISFVDMLKIVNKRAELVSGLVNGHNCGMFAVKHYDMDVSSLINQCKNLTNEYRIVDISIINSKDEIIISYFNYTYEELRDYFKEYRVIKLNVNAPYHSSALRPICITFSNYLDNFHFNLPQIDVISNVTGQPVEAFSIKDDLLKHLIEPINMYKCISYINNQDVHVFIEVSFSRVISKIIYKLYKTQCYNLTDQNEYESYIRMKIDNKEKSLLNMCMEMTSLMLSSSKNVMEKQEVDESLEFYIEEIKSLMEKKSKIEDKFIMNIVMFYRNYYKHNSSAYMKTINDIFSEHGLDVENYDENID